MPGGDQRPRLGHRAAPGGARRPAVQLHPPAGGRGPAHGHAHRRRAAPDRRRHDIITTRSEVTDEPASRCAPSAPPRAVTVHRGGPVTRSTTRRRGDALQPQTYAVTRADLVRYAGAQRRPQPDPLDRAGRPLGRAARRDRPRHVHPGAGRPRRRPTGPATRAAVVELGVRVHQARWSCPTTTTAPTVEVDGTVTRSVDDGRSASRSSPSTATVLGKAKVLGQLA